MPKNMFKISKQYQDFLSQIEIYGLNLKSMKFKFMHDGIMHYKYIESNGLIVDLQIVANDTFLDKMPFKKLIELNFIKHFNVLFSEGKDANNRITWTLFESDFNTRIQL